MNSSIDLNESLEKGSTISSIAPGHCGEGGVGHNDDALVTKTIMKLKKELAEKEMEMLEVKNQEYQ